MWSIETLILFYFLFIATLMVCAFIMFMVWIYADAPNPFRSHGNDPELRYISLPPSYQNSKSKIFSRHHRSIIRPWESKKGYMNMGTINISDWIERDEDMPAEVYISRMVNKSNHTFAISKEYNNIVTQASYELLENIIDHINSAEGALTILKSIDSNGVIIRVEDAIFHRSWEVYANISFLNTTRVVDCDNEGRYHPLQVARFLVAEDLNLLTRERLEPFRHILIASALSFPDKWHLEAKIGQPLAAIHYPINALNSARETKYHHTYYSSSPIIRAMEKFFDTLYDPSTITESASVSVNNSPIKLNDPSSYSNIYSCPPTNKSNHNNDINSINNTRTNPSEAIPKFLNSRTNWTFQHHPFITNRFYDNFSYYRDNMREFMKYLLVDELKELSLRARIREGIVYVINIIRMKVFQCQEPLEIFLRSERQTFRYLSRSNTVLFTIRTRVIPMKEVILTRAQAGKLEDALRHDLKSDDNSGKCEYKEELINWIQTRMRYLQE